MRKSILLTLVLALGTTGPAGIAAADVVDYDITQAGASSPSGIRPGEVVTALNSLVLEYNQGMSWNITLGGDPIRVLETQPVPQAVTLGELISHDGSSYVIYDRLAVRAVVQWIGYDTGELPGVKSELVGYWTDEGLFDADGRLWLNSGASGASSGTIGSDPPLRESLLPIPEPSTLAITVIAGSAILSLFRRRRYGHPA